jgi:hypothetical protein
MDTKSNIENFKMAVFWVVESLLAPSSGLRTHRPDDGGSKDL